MMPSRSHTRFLHPLALSLVALLAACGGGSGTSPAPTVDTAALMVQLGEDLFFDSGLSDPPGQSCASCHDPDQGFADPDATADAPVSEGAVAGMFGNRNAPTAAYAAFVPEFSYQPQAMLNPGYRGGLFVDGRARDLAEQARAPLLNPREMANPDPAAVVTRLRDLGYAPRFEEIWGPGALDDVDAAYEHLAEAIAAYESGPDLNPFSSRYDAYLAGEVELSEQEARGLDLFQGRALCSECHVIGPLALFTDFSYSNIGVPPNPSNPVYLEDPGFVDLGLGDSPKLQTDAAAEAGRFRVPTLRNVALTAPYMHNGVFATLEQVVHFYNTRDQLRCDRGGTPLVDCWPDPEVDGATLVTDRVGDLLLSADQEADLVAFLKTLTDGYTPP